MFRKFCSVTVKLGFWDFVLFLNQWRDDILFGLQKFWMTVFVVII